MTVETHFSHRVAHDLTARAQLSYLGTCGDEEDGAHAAVYTRIVVQCLLMMEASTAHGKEVDDLPPPGPLDVSEAYGKRVACCTFRAFSQVQAP